MRYYLDTEFNGFGGPLISLALVPEDDAMAPFYAAVDCPHPTAWVLEHVLPVLGVDPVSAETLTVELQDYLRDDPHPVLVADWPEDIALAARAMIRSPGRRINIDRVSFELCDAFGFDAAVLSRVPHNAYHDAVALRDYHRRRGGC